MTATVSAFFGYSGETASRHDLEDESGTVRDDSSKVLSFQTGLKRAIAFAKGWANTALLLIAVDGHSAAGKSTFAKRLTRALPNSTLIHTDDFYRVMDEAERFALDAKGGYEWYYTTGNG